MVSMHEKEGTAVLQAATAGGKGKKKGHGLDASLGGGGRGGGGRGLRPSFGC